MSGANDGPDRYLYCLVDAGAGDPASFETTGVGDEPVRVDVVDGIGAVVHDCDGLYDASDPRQVRSWLLAHQSVVDDATEAFGTPLPVRFDTVFEGGDAGLREWIRSVADDATAALDRFAGRREYRVGVRWDDEGFAERMRAEDDRLAEIAAARDDAGDGGAFLREKQYEQRLEDLRRGRHEALADDLRERVEEVVAAWTEQDPGGGDALAPADTADDDGGTEVVRLAVLADRSDEERLGERLDEYVDAHDDVEVRFTGPWPPYTFAPALEGEA